MHYVALFLACGSARCCSVTSLASVRMTLTTDLWCVASLLCGVTSLLCGALLLHSDNRSVARYVFAILRWAFFSLACAA